MLGGGVLLRIITLSWKDISQAYNLRILMPFRISSMVLVLRSLFFIWMSWYFFNFRATIAFSGPIRIITARPWEVVTLNYSIKMVDTVAVILTRDKCHLIKLCVINFEIQWNKKLNPEMFWQRKLIKYVLNSNLPARDDGPRTPHKKYRARMIWRGLDQNRLR